MSADIAMTDSNPTGTTITVRGPLDAFTTPALTALIDQALPAMTAPHTLVIDLRGLDFLAAAGVRALVRTADRCRDQQLDCCLVVGPEDEAHTVLARLEAPASLRIVEHPDLVHRPSPS